MRWMFWKKKAFRVDCSGLTCPQPVIATKEALEAGHRLLEVVVDNEAAKNNVIRFAQDQHCTVSDSESENGCWTLTVKAGRVCCRKQAAPEKYSCASTASTRTGGLVYVISSASMGQGSADLGWALLQTYVQTIHKIEPLPEKILLYNEGVRLVAEDSGALQALKELQEQGVEILACGTCLNYYELTSALQVGKIADMYAIMSTVNQATQVVSPS
ncbi:MAG: sulfurtransferase-like selenium metabolism protein YedF [Candidatus Electrothrix sp. AW5]|nr:sulfurtransferase-like selenium metabolism protein YedF [Candidatus Electrothrix gigas]MCI5227979.1 sulfurtransferase-like selenium metabolism protein YedF [Candidatus Electrothrix gigas]